MTAMKHHAKGWINITSYESKIYDEAGGGKISEVHVADEFSGDFVGTGSARFLMVTDAGCGDHFTGMERFIGKLGERSGSFILQNSGKLKDGVLQSEWLVVSGSGTGELSGLRGEGGCRSADGVFLDYWFE